MIVQLRRLIVYSTTADSNVRPWQVRLRQHHALPRLQLPQRPPRRRQDHGGREPGAVQPPHAVLHPHQGGQGAHPDSVQLLSRPQCPSCVQQVRSEYNENFYF